MIRSYFGWDNNPFSHKKIELLPQQQEIFDTIKVHSQQGGLYLLIGEPGTGKSVIKENYWRWPSRNLDGNTIDFFTKVEKLTFSQAMKILAKA